METLFALMFLWFPLSSLDDTYLGAGTGYFNYTAVGGSSFDLYGLHVRAGAGLNEYLGIEVRGGLSTQDENRISGVPTDINIKHFGAAYAVAKWPLNEEVTPYALLGLSKTEIRERSLAGSPSVSESSFSYGLGVDYEFEKDLLIGGEYISYHDDNKLGEIDAFTVNLTFRL